MASSRKAIELSAPHIYLSAIPFADQKSLVYKEFSQYCTGVIAVETLGICHHGSRAVITLTGHTNAVRSIAYSASDRRLLISGSDDGTVRVWDTHTGEKVMPPLHSGDGAVLSVDFARNHMWISCGTETGTVCIWDIATRHASNQRLSGHSGPVNCVVFSRDSSRLASASEDKTVCLWDPERGQQLAVVRGHTDPVDAIAFSPDSRVLASVSRDETIRLWHTATGLAACNPLRHNGCDHVDFSPSEDMLAGACKDGVFLWNSITLEIISKLHTDPRTHTVRFSPNGQLLVAACDPGIRLWTLQPDPSKASWVDLDGRFGRVCSMTFSPNGLYIAAAYADGAIRIWSAASGSAIQPLPAHASPVNSVAVSRDGAFIVSGSDDNSVRVWKARNGRPALPPLRGHTRPVLFVKISPNGRLIASASTDCTVRLWDTLSGAMVGEPIRHTDDVMAVDLSSNGHWLASASHKAVRVWNITKRRPIIGPLCNGVVQTVAFSPDDELVAAGDQCGGVYIWRNEPGRQVYEPLSMSNERIISIAFSPNGTCIASGAQDTAIYVWDAVASQCILALHGITSSVLSVTWSLDGSFISSASSDGAVRLWNAQTGTLLATLQGHSDEVISVAFTSDGRHIVSGSKDNVIRKWDVDASYKLLSEQDPVMALRSATINDGWLLGPSGELLVWVPAEYRTTLQIPPCTMVIGQSRISLTIESGGWHRGEDWISCWQGDPTYQQKEHTSHEQPENREQVQWEVVESEQLQLRAEGQLVGEKIQSPLRREREEATESERLQIERLDMPRQSATANFKDRMTLDRLSLDVEENDLAQGECQNEGQQLRLRREGEERELPRRDAEKGDDGEARDHAIINALVREHSQQLEQQQKAHERYQKRLHARHDTSKRPQQETVYRESGEELQRRLQRYPRPEEEETSKHDRIMKSSNTSSSILSGHASIADIITNPAVFASHSPRSGSAGRIPIFDTSSSSSSSLQRGSHAAAAWAAHERAWSELLNTASEHRLRWADIPWPMETRPRSMEDLSTTAIASFLLSPFHSQGRSDNDRLRLALRHWQLDNFQRYWLPKCAEVERVRILNGVGFVVRCLNELMSARSTPVSGAL